MKQIRHDLNIELARFKMHFTESEPPYVFVFERHLAITNALSQTVVVDATMEITSEEELIIETVLKDIGQ